MAEGAHMRKQKSAQTRVDSHKEERRGRRLDTTLSISLATQFFQWIPIFSREISLFSLRKIGIL
jgi:hypothetical protein